MRLNNHIALRFLTDDTLAIELLETTHPGEYHKLLKEQELDKIENAKLKSLWDLVNKDGQRAYFVTDTVNDKLDMLKVKRGQDGWYDWTVFKDIPHCKKTFILKPEYPRWDGGGVLRLFINDEFLQFCHIGFKFDKTKGKPGDGQILWTLFHVNTKTNEHADHCTSQNVQDIYDFVYKLMCFIFLSENEYQVVQPGQSHGTRKKDKLVNDLPVPITIIDSKWNITVIRTEGFPVSGHLALRRCGPCFSQTRMVLIQPFEKHGYIRKAKNIQEITV